jgi:hypothetical protein
MRYKTYEVNAMKITPIEAGHKIQLPAEWATELGLADVAVLEKTAEGILVRPCCPADWDTVFSDKLSIGQQASAMDLSEVSGDDLLL